MRRIVLLLLVVALAVTVAVALLPGLAARLGNATFGWNPAQADRAHNAPQAIAVTTAIAKTADFPVRRYAIGFLVSPAVVDIGARVSSQVVEIKVKDGQMVAAGDVLFQLDDRSLKAAVARDEATLAKDQAQLVSLQSDLARAKDLLVSQAGTQQAYDQALAAERSAAATVAADQAALDADQVQLSYATIAAPITGRLGVVNTTVGDLVGSSSGESTGTPLVTVTQMDPLQVQFTLPETELALLQKGLASSSPPTVTLHRDGDDRALGTGNVDFIDSSVDTASGTITVKATIPNAGLSLWPGQYVDVTVNAGMLPGLVSIPTVAVQQGQKGPFVYVVKKPDETVSARPVTVVVTQGDSSGVSQGVQNGERVVVEGQLRLAEGVKVREGVVAAGDNGAASSDESTAQ